MIGVVGVLRIAPRGPLTASFSRATTLSAGLKVTSADLGTQSKRSTFLSMTSFLTLSRLPLPKEELEKFSVVRLRWVELLFRLKAFDLLDENERLEPKLFVEAPRYVEEVKPRPASARRKPHSVGQIDGPRPQHRKHMPWGCDGKKDGCSSDGVQLCEPT